MKRFIFFIILLLFSSPIFGQQEAIADKQLLLGCINVGSSETVYHYISAKSDIWQYNLSGEYFYSGGVSSSTLTSIGNLDLQDDDWPGFNFSWLLAEPHWSLSLYKVTNSKQTDKYFYIDSRDSDFGTAEYPVDTYIYFDNTAGAYFHRDGTEIDQGEVVRIWEVHNQPPNTTGLPNYWSNILIDFESGNHPRLVWGPYPSTTLSINNYRVYRKYGQSAYQLLATVSSTTYEYIDESVSFVQPGGAAGVTVQYKVAAVYNTTQQTGYSNSVSYYVKGQQIEKTNNGENQDIKSAFKLDQNYPNPFNPSTRIAFYISENAFVSLKVYDTLGNEIQDLINQEMSSGDYSVNFDGSNLSSGIYFYRLNVNDNSTTKMMMLTK